MRDTLALPLLEYLAYQAGCLYPSDLRYTDQWQRRDLARKLEKVSAEAVSLREWNDMLEYLVQAPPEPTAVRARARLINGLESPSSPGEGDKAKRRMR